MLLQKKWKANIIREYNELIYFLCWIMPFIHEQKSKTKQKLCLYKYIFILSQSLRCWRWITKIMSDLWCLFYMCVSINNTKKAPTTKACSFFSYILQTLDNIFVREAFFISLWNYISYFSWTNFYRNDNL